MLQSVGKKCEDRSVLVGQPCSQEVERVVFTQRGIRGNVEMQHCWGIAEDMDKCTVFPKEEMSRMAKTV